VENEPEVIRQQMQETRTSLTEKLEALEQQVTGTVQEAKAAVTDTVTTVKDAVTGTVDAVKDTVQDTVESVKETLDLRRQVERHPWAMLGGSVAAGFVGGCLFDLAAEELNYATRRRRSAAFTHRNGAPLLPAASERAAGPSWMEELADKFHDEIGQLKGLAIGAALGVARDLLAQSTPDNLRGQVTELLDSITTKLGGQPMRGPVLGDSWQGPQSRERERPAPAV
jgi:ElaB/YqjD/DUF883 family membrane-anchored ribosome-binding protein